MSKFKQLMVSSILLTLIACGQSPKADLVVGTIAGPETDLVKVAQQQVKQQGLNVKIIEFNDYNLPNEALADGSIDMNIYQHQPFLKASINAKSYPIEAIGKTFIYPMGIYSKKHTNLSQLPNKALIAIPNDPSNETRALLLLSQAGLIKVLDKDTLTPRDITANSKNLQIKELDAAQLPRVLIDVDAAVINTTFAIPAGLVPGKDSIFLESKDSPYANLIVVRQGEQQKPAIQKFLSALHSQAVIDKAHSLFGNGAVSAW
jgi:D-methionine transport system substrate-binding protein